MNGFGNQSVHYVDIDHCMMNGNLRFDGYNAKILWLRCPYALERRIGLTHRIAIIVSILLKEHM